MVTTGSECSLKDRECLPCSGNVEPLSAAQSVRLLKELGGDWDVRNDLWLEKEFSFSNFRKALDFTVAVGELSEEVGHHPEVLLAWGLVKITLWTHKIGGLSENDFILAARFDHLFSRNQL